MAERFRIHMLAPRKYKINEQELLPKMSMKFLECKILWQRQTVDVALPYERSHLSQRRAWVLIRERHSIRVSLSNRVFG